MNSSGRKFLNKRTLGGSDLWNYERRQQAIISKWSQYVSNITASWRLSLCDFGEGEKL